MYQIVLYCDDQFGIDTVRRALTAEMALSVTTATSDVDAIESLINNFVPNFLIAILGNNYSIINRIAHLLEDSPRTKVIVVASSSLPPTKAGDLIHMIKAGGVGYVCKDSGLPKLIEAIQTMTQKDTFTDPTLINQKKLEGALSFNKNQLTVRENDVFRLLAQGKDNHEISHELSIQADTVKSHVSKILSKLGISRQKAIVLAYEQHLFDA